MKSSHTSAPTAEHNYQVTKPENAQSIIQGRLNCMGQADSDPEQDGDMFHSKQ